MSSSEVNREALLARLQRLLPAQFAVVVFRAGVPESMLPGPGAPQVGRAIELIRYLEQGDRLADLPRLLDEILMQAAGCPASKPDLPAAGAAMLAVERAVVEPSVASGTRREADLPVAAMEKPAWAVASGPDHHGRWAAFEVEGLRHRVRWIPPETFLMGSPRSEPDREDDEGPQHWVTITKGYWLGETPVTQPLWVAIMGHNPSCYRGDRPEDLERPVERVSWDECQVFLHGLNVKVPGLTARLPTEAEWERACRAGRTGTTPESELSDARMALPGFLEAFLDDPLFPKPYPVTRGAPNPFGLHDMLGNVWEWCADDPRCYTFDPVTDPAHIGHDQNRVGRGGSMAIKSRSPFSLRPSLFSRHSLNRPRAAYRLRRSRAFRNHGIGFRLAAS